ncbi:MAG: hypothetical protein AB8U44_02415 [Aaplasma endosymbiont of Hyalomma asiaticum]
MLIRPQGNLGQYILTTHDLLLCRDENYKCSPEKLIKAFSSGFENSQPDLVQNPVSDRTLGHTRVLATRLYEIAKACQKSRPVAREMWSALAAAYISPTSGKSDKEDFGKFLLSCVSAPQACAVRQDPATCRLHVDQYSKTDAHKHTLSIMESCVYHVLDKDHNKLLNLLINVRYEVGYSSKEDKTPNNVEGSLFRLTASSIDIALRSEGSQSYANDTIGKTRRSLPWSTAQNTPGRLHIGCVGKIAKFYVHVVPAQEHDGDALIYTGSSENIYLSKFNLQMKKPDHMGRRVLNAAYNADSAVSYIVGAWAGVANSLVKIECFESSCKMISDRKKGISYSIEGTGLFRVDGCLVCADIEYVVAPHLKDSTQLTLTTLRAIIGEKKFDSYVGTRGKNGELVRVNITYDASIKSKFTITIPGLDLYKAAAHKYTCQSSKVPAHNIGDTGEKLSISASQNEIAGVISDSGGILGDTGIVRKTMENLVCCILACGSAHVSQIDHRVAHGGIVNWESQTPASSANHVLEEHFLFYCDHKNDTRVHVCASYTVGDYRGLDSATLSDLKVGFRLVNNDFNFTGVSIPASSFSWISLDGCKAACNCEKLRGGMGTINSVATVGNSSLLATAGGNSVLLDQDGDIDVANTAIKVALEKVVDHYTGSITRYVDDSQRVFENVKGMVGNPFCSVSDTAAFNEMLENGKVTFVPPGGASASTEHVFFVPVVTRDRCIHAGGMQQQAENRVAVLKGLRGLVGEKSLHYAVLEVIANILSSEKPLKMAQDLCDALTTQLLQNNCGVYVVDHTLTVDTSCSSPGVVDLTHNVLLSPRVWWKKTGSETGSVLVSIKFPVKVESGAASRTGYIIFDPVKIVVHKLGKSVSCATAGQSVLFEKEIKTHGCCVSLLDVVTSSHTVYNRAYMYMLHDAGSSSAPSEQSSLESKIQSAVEEFVNLHGICCVLRVPEMSFETRSDVYYYEDDAENSRKDLATLNVEMLQAIQDLLMQGSHSTGLMQFVCSHLDRAKIEISRPRVANDSLAQQSPGNASALRDDKGIKIVQQCTIEVPSIRSSNVSAILIISYNAQMRRKIGDRWVIAVSEIDISHMPGSVSDAGKSSANICNSGEKRSIMRISSACNALLVDCRVIDHLSARSSGTVAENSLAKGMKAATPVESSAVACELGAVATSSADDNAHATPDRDAVKTAKLKSGSVVTELVMPPVAEYVESVEDGNAEHQAPKNPAYPAATHSGTNSVSPGTAVAQHTQSGSVGESASQDSASTARRENDPTQKTTATSVGEHMTITNGDVGQRRKYEYEVSRSTKSTSSLSKKAKNAVPSVAEQQPSNAACGEDRAHLDSCNSAEETGSVSEVKEAKLHAALYGALREQAFPDDKSIKKLLGVLVNIATDGRIMCADAYVGGRVPLRTSYSKSSDNELFVAYYMIAESAKYGVLEIELQYEVVRTENPRLAGGVVHTVKEGRFFIKGNNADLASESVHRIAKPIVIAETKWDTFVGLHKKCLDLEREKLGLWYRFTEFVGKVRKAIVTFLCKICSYFSCVFCCFHHKIRVSKTHGECTTSDNAKAPTYKDITTAVANGVGPEEKTKDAAEAERGFLSPPAEKDDHGSCRTPSSVITGTGLSAEPARIVSPVAEAAL